MKSGNVLLVIGLAIGLTIPAMGQHQHGTQQVKKRKSHDMSAMMGTPVFDRSVEGLRIKVWLIAQEAHKKMMSGQMKGEMKGDMKGMMHGEESKGDMHSMDHNPMSAMISGTHHIMVSLIDEKTKVEPDKAKVEVRIVAPSKRNSSTELSKMKGHFGGGITLDEKGEYTISLKIEERGITALQVFSYRVQ
jgi:hypothetical protein